MKLKLKDIASKLKKQNIKITLGIVFDDQDIYGNPTPIENLLSRIKEIKANNKKYKKFYYKLSVDGPYYEGDPVSASFEVWGERPETDAEFKQRIKTEWNVHKQFCKTKCRHI